MSQSVSTGQACPGPLISGSPSPALGSSGVAPAPGNPALQSDNIGGGPSAGQVALIGVGVLAAAGGGAYLLGNLGQKNKKPAGTGGTATSASSPGADAASSKTPGTKAETLAHDPADFSHVFVEPQVDSDCGLHASNAMLNGLWYKFTSPEKLREKYENAIPELRKATGDVEPVAGQFVDARGLEQWHNMSVAALRNEARQLPPDEREKYRPLLQEVEANTVHFDGASFDEMLNKKDGALQRLEPIFADRPASIRRAMVMTGLGPSASTTSTSLHWVALAWKKSAEEKEGAWYRADSLDAEHPVWLCNAKDDAAGLRQAIIANTKLAYERYNAGTPPKGKAQYGQIEMILPKRETAKPSLPPRI